MGCLPSTSSELQLPSQFCQRRRTGPCWHQILGLPADMFLKFSCGVTTNKSFPVPSTLTSNVGNSIINLPFGMVYGTFKNCDLGDDLWHWVYHITPNLHQSSSKLQSFRLLRSDCSWRFTLAVFAACLLFLACRLFRGHSPTSTCISMVYVCI